MEKMRELISANEITEDLFEDVVVFAVGELGAMGAPCFMQFVPKNRDAFCLTYGDKIPYSSIRSSFSVLNDCVFNGPLPGEPSDGEIVLYPENGKRLETHVPEGWEHIYMGYGNHLLVKKEYFSIFCKYIEDLKQPVDIYCEWEKRLDGFLEEINKY